jgi:hypothetical protein
MSGAASRLLRSSKWAFVLKTVGERSKWKTLVRRVNNELRGIDVEAEHFQKRILARFDKESDANTAKTWFGLLQDLKKAGPQGGVGARAVGMGEEWGKKGGAGSEAGSRGSRPRSSRSGSLTPREMEAGELGEGWWGGGGGDKGRGRGGGSEAREVLARMEAMFQCLMGR